MVAADTGNTEVSTSGSSLAAWPPTDATPPWSSCHPHPSATSAPWPCCSYTGQLSDSCLSLCYKHATKLCPLFCPHPEAESAKPALAPCNNVELQHGDGLLHEFTFCVVVLVSVVTGAAKMAAIHAYDWSVSDVVCATQEGPGEAAVQALNEAVETPERLWTPAMKASTAEELAHLANQAHAAQVCCCAVLTILC